MKHLRQMLSEVKGEKAHRDAIAMGLKYKGFGYWADPSTGETKYKTENDTLVPVEAEQESEKYKGTGGKELPGMDGAAGGMGMSGANSAGAMMGMPGGPQGGDGSNVGNAPTPGEELAPFGDDITSWNPGPDGDTCVGPEAERPPAAIAKDSFVGKTNYYAWTAGPDGSNITNVTLENIKEQIKEAVIEGSDADREMARLVRKFNFDKELANRKQPTPKVDYNDDYNAIVTGAKDAVRKIGDIDRPAQQQAISNYRHKKGQGEPAIKSFAKKLPQIADTAKERIAGQEDKRGKILDAIHSHFKNEGYFADPKFDLDQDQMKGEFLGDGSYGQVAGIGDAAIKEGAIGPHELMALHKLRSNPHFPNLLNGRLKTPFANLDPRETNPLGLSDYKDLVTLQGPQSGLALGKFAMQRIKGALLGALEPAGSQLEQNPELMEEMQRKFWDIRGQMHREGISHNDMHLDNVMYDPETGHMSMIDFGLANIDPVAALMEALGGMDPDLAPAGLGDEQMNNPERWEGAGGANEDGEPINFPLAAMMGPRGGMLPEDLRDSLVANHSKIREKLLEELGPEEQEWIEEFMHGGISLNATQLQEAARHLGILEEDSDQYSEDGINDVRAMIDMLYDGISFAPGEREEEEEEEAEEEIEEPEEKKPAKPFMLNFADKVRERRSKQPSKFEFKFDD